MYYVIGLMVSFVIWYMGLRMGFKMGYITAMEHSTIQVMSALAGVGKAKVSSVAPTATPSMEDDSTTGGNA